MKKILSSIGIGPWRYNWWKQNDEVREITHYIRDTYITPWKKIDLMEVISRFKKDTPIATEVHVANVNTKCQFNVSLSNSLCIYCGRPKWHVDLHWWNCKSLENNNIK